MSLAIVETPTRFVKIQTRKFRLELCQEPNNSPPNNSGIEKVLIDCPKKAILF